MSFFAALAARPTEPLSPLARYTVANGLFYLLLGALLYAGAGPIVDLIAQLEGTGLQEVGLVRVVGMAVGIIGFFYIMGGRTNADSFGLATVADRLLVPFLLLPLWALGELPASLALPFALLDPLLGLGAYAIWARSRRTSPE